MSIKGLQYFPLDVNFFEDSKISIIISDYGLEATAVVLKLFSQIYKNGFYLDWNEKTAKIFTATFHSRYKCATLLKMVESMVEEGIFDKEKYETYHILTSEEIQNCFFMATTRRKKRGLEKAEYLLDAYKHYASTDQDVASDDNSACKNAKNADISEQSKEKETKQNEMKENKKLSCCPRCAREEEEHNLNLENNQSDDIPLIPAEEVTDSPDIIIDYPVYQPSNPSNSFKNECLKIRNELFRDVNWLYSVTMFCGKPHEVVLSELPGVMELFENHVVSIGESESILNINDYKRRLKNWWHCVDYGSAAEILKQEQRKKKEVPRDRHDRYKKREPVSNVEKAYATAERAANMAMELLNNNNEEFLWKH